MCKCCRILNKDLNIRGCGTLEGQGEGQQAMPRDTEGDSGNQDTETQAALREHSLCARPLGKDIEINAFPIRQTSHHPQGKSSYPSLSHR